MKKILISIMTIGVAAAFLGAGTFSYFTDMETSTNNTFTAGIIDLVVDNQNPLQGHQVQLDDMKPCDWTQIKVKLSKTGDSNAGPVWFHINNVAGTDGLHPESEPTDGIHDIQNWIDFDLYIDDGDGVYEPDEDTCLIHPDDHMSIGMLECVWIKIGLLNTPIFIWLSFHLRAETGNSYQGDVCTFDLEYLMQQHNMEAYPPGNKVILENKEGPSWVPILGDGIWGIAEYSISSLNLDIEAYGLPTDERDLQIGLTSPEDATWYPVDAVTRVAMASALASDVYDGNNPGTAPPASFNLYERGYNQPGASTLHTNFATGDQGTYIVATDYGATPSAANADTSGYLDWTGIASLPSGTYSFIKILIKDDSSPWGTHLMEKDTPLSFVIP